MKGYYAIGVFTLLVVLFASIISANNTAIGLEQNIKESQSGIQIQEKRQHDLIPRLVEIVEHAAQYEKETQTQIAELRTNAGTMSAEQVMTLISAVAEAYPQLQANQDYLQLMTEMSISENLKAQYRETYNADVTAYQRYVRRFPTRLWLSVAGYEIQSFEYLEFDNTELPDQLFK